MKEIWKPIIGYENLYQVSNLGKIKSLKRNIILKPSHNRKGYLQIILYKNKNKKVGRIHRLVAEAFIPNENNFTDVNHIDGNKHNNKVENLEWCNRSYNLKHAYENGLRPTIKQLCEEIENLKKEIKEIKENNCYKIGDE